MDSELTQAELDFLKMTAKYVTMVVRNSIEDFHTKYIPEDQMKDFNTTVRNAIFTALYAKETMTRSQRSEEYVRYHWEMMPKYWEEPEFVKGFKK